MRPWPVTWHLTLSSIWPWQSLNLTSSQNPWIYLKNMGWFQISISWALKHSKCPRSLAFFLGGQQPLSFHVFLKAITDQILLYGLQNLCYLFLELFIHNFHDIWCLKCLKNEQTDPELDSALTIFHLGHWLSSRFEGILIAQISLSRHLLCEQPLQP